MDSVLAKLEYIIFENMDCFYRGKVVCFGDISNKIIKT